MARVDKTDSTVGVVRAVLAADYTDAELRTVIGVGLDTTGKVVPGAGNTGIIGVVNPSRTARKAGTPVDIFVLADICDIGRDANDATLAAGSKIYASTTTGVLSLSATGATYVGFTVEADRLIVAIGGNA